MTQTLAGLAVKFGCELRGDPSIEISALGTIRDAGRGALTFLSNPAYRRDLAETKASCVVLAPADAEQCPVACLVCDDPYLVYARIANEIHPPQQGEPGVHERAVVAGSASVPDSVSIGANAVIGDRVELGERCFVGPGCVLESGVRIGDDGRLAANVTVCRDVQFGKRCSVQPGAVIGGDGFGYAPSPDGWVKIPQIGSVRVGDDVEIGANSCIDRGAIGDTVIGDGVKIDNLVQIAHNVQIGAHSALAGLSGIAGSTTIGERCLFAGNSGAVGHVNICDDVIVSGKCMITRDIKKPGRYGAALPADEMGVYRRNVARFRQLDKLARRVRELEKLIDRKKHD